MSTLYEELQVTAAEVLAEFKQDASGSLPVKLLRTAETDGAQPWDPTEGVTTEYTVDATASGVTKDLVDGKDIVASDILVTMAGGGAVEPLSTDKIEVNGKVSEIKRIIAVPASGTPVLFKIVVRG